MLWHTFVLQTRVYSKLQWTYLQNGRAPYYLSLVMSFCMKFIRIKSIIQTLFSLSLSKKIPKFYFLSFVWFGQFLKKFIRWYVIIYPQLWISYQACNQISSYLDKTKLRPVYHQASFEDHKNITISIFPLIILQRGSGVFLTDFNLFDLQRFWGVFLLLHHVYYFLVFGFHLDRCTNQKTHVWLISWPKIIQWYKP